MVVVAGIDSFGVVFIIVMEVEAVSYTVVNGSASSVVVKGGITVSFDVAVGLAGV
jgi:hypothetical protein